MRRLTTILATGLLTALTLSGCSDDDSSTSPGGGSGLADAYSVESALRELPDSTSTGGGALQVFTGDIARATELAALPKPTDESSTVAWATGLIKPPLFMPLAQDLGLERIQTGSMRSTLGFDARDVETYTALESGSDNIVVMRLAADAKPKKDVTTTGDGKVGDLDRTATTMPAFPFILGVGQQGDRVALTRKAEVLANWQDNGGKTLADHDDLLDLAKALDEHDVYGASLSDRPARPPLPPMRDSQQLAAAAPMPAFEAVGVGEAVEDGAPVEYVAYRVADAEQAAPEIEKVWREGTSLLTNRPLSTSATVDDVTTSGNVVLVRLTPVQGSGIAQQMLLRSDAPFVVLP